MLWGYPYFVVLLCSVGVNLVSLAVGLLDLKILMSDRAYMRHRLLQRMSALSRSSDTDKNTREVMAIHKLMHLHFGEAEVQRDKQADAEPAKRTSDVPKRPCGTSECVSN